MSIPRLNTIRVPAGWLAVAVLLLCGIANARPVFDAPGRVISPVEAQRVESDPVAVPGRYRLARIDREGILSSIDQDLPLVFNLFNDVEARGRARSKKGMEGGSTFASGALEDGGHFTLFLHHSGVVRGEIHSAQGFYSLKSAGRDRSQVLIQQKDLSLLPGCGSSHHSSSDSHSSHRHGSPDGHETPGASQSRAGGNPGIAGKSAQGAGSETIDILVLYTQRVEDYEGGPAQIKATIENEIAKMNQVLENSGLSHRKVKLAGMEKVDYEQGDGLGDDYRNLSRTKE